MKKLYFMLLGLVLLGSTFAVESITYEDLHSNLDLGSKLRLSLLKPFTIEGQKEGCSVYPEVVVTYFHLSSSQSFNPMKLLSYEQSKKLNKKGKINQYVIDKSGKWYFIEEVDYGDSIYVLKGFKYAFEFYNCPEDSVKVTSVYDCKTPDGKKQGDLICKANSYVAKVDFSVVNGVCQVDYKKVASCKAGCDYLTATCNKYSDDSSTVVETVTSDNRVVETWSDREIEEEYKLLIEQLNNKIVDLQKLQEALETQDLSSDEVSEELGIEGDAKEYINSELDNLNRVKSDLDSDLSGVGLVRSFLVGLVVLLVGLVVWRFVR